MNPALKRAFEKWVPPAAVTQISAWLNDPVFLSMRPLLERLADDPAMKTVWSNLPNCFAKREDQVLVRVLFAYEFVRPLRPKTLTRGRSKIQNYNGNASRAKFLLDGMRQLEISSRDCWEEFWPGDHSITFDNLMELIQQSIIFYERLEAWDAERFEALQLPPLRRKLGGERAREIYFSDIMSDYFLKTCGAPMDPIVVALTDVVFDHRGDIHLETARSRRRSAPAHSRKKST